jgi:hypothetical protein
MWKSFFKTTYKKVSFEDIQFIIKNPDNFILINTLPLEQQNCLIKNTILYQNEETIINELIAQYEYKSRRIIIYGANANDECAEKKYDQLVALGFQYVYLYMGGMFEWLHLQDIYGSSEFPTTAKTLDILKYKPNRTFGGRMIAY